MNSNYNREQKIEALKEFYNYNVKLVKAIEDIIPEMSNKIEDTDKLLSSIVDGINWTIEVLNRTLDVINENENRIDKDTINKYILALGEALQEKNDKKIETALRDGMLPFLKELAQSIKKVI